MGRTFFSTFAALTVICLAGGPPARAVSAPSATPAPEQNSSFGRAFKDYEAAGDDLALRILVKRQALAVPTYAEWLETRKLLHRRPGIGYSLLFKWDEVPFRGAKSAETRREETKVDSWMKYADDLMSAEKFQTAFAYYQAIARYLKKEIGAGKTDNQLFYQMVLHSMARALHGAGRFEDALKVYNWIGKNYPRYRQVLFEKMWSAFRANHADLALGAIASQQSTYFSDFMEPEAYLVQLYIYKKLCRVDEQKAIRLVVAKFRDQLKSGEYDYAQWATSDLENYSLYRLTQQKISGGKGPVSVEEKQKEQLRIEGLLKERFGQEKSRLLRELNHILAYSYLAVGAGSLRTTQTELDHLQLRENGREFWPVDDAEDWIDELGEHLYIGKSECQAK